MVSIIELIPKDVLALILVKSDSSSLIKFCVASKYVNSICTTIKFRLYYFDAKYGLKYELTKGLVTKLNFCEIAQKYISIIKITEAISPKKIFIDEHKINHPKVKKECDMCMYVGLNDFQKLMKLYLHTYPQLFLIENQNTIERSRLNAKNIIFMFGKAHILTGISQDIPYDFIEKFSIKKNHFSQFQW